MQNLVWLIFIATLAQFILITSGNYSSLEFISQQMIAVSEEKFNLVQPYELYQGFLNYITERGRLTSAYYNKLVNIFKIIEQKFMPIK